jgi:cardiolipin synthase
MEIDSVVVGVMSAAEAVWVVLVTIYLVLERRSPQATLAWIFALSFLPAIGILAYLFFGPRRFERRKRRRARAKQAIKGEITFEGAAKHDFRDHITHLAEMCEASVGLSARARCADVTLYFDGASLYDALEEAIRSATHHVHVEYYIWQPVRRARGSATRSSSARVRASKYA